MARALQEALGSEETVGRGSTEAQTADVSSVDLQVPSPTTALAVEAAEESSEHLSLTEVPAVNSNGARVGGAGSRKEDNMPRPAARVAHDRV